MVESDADVASDGDGDVGRERRTGVDDGPACTNRPVGLGQPRRRRWGVAGVAGTAGTGTGTGTGKAWYFWVIFGTGVIVNEIESAVAHSANAAVDVGNDMNGVSVADGSGAGE